MPVSAKPTAAISKAAKSGSAKSGSAKSDSAKPGSAKSRAAKPGAAKPAQKSGAAGTQTRRLVAQKLAPILAGTQSRFSPFSPDEIAEPRERALANKLVTVALRRRGHIAHIAETLLERGLPKRSGLFTPLLYLGLAELLFLPDRDDHAVLFTTVEILKTDRRGARHAKLLNAVLRTAQRRAPEFAQLPAPLLFPHWLNQKWSRVYGPQHLVHFAQALTVAPPLDLSLKSGTNPDEIGLEGTRLAPRVLRLSERDRPVDALPGYAEGAWWVQDFAATLAARLIGQEAGAEVLDMCAAPGGKTAQLCDFGYRTTALDADSARLDRLKSNLDRLGLRCTTETGQGESFGNDGQFDAVLLDAPCTATGTFRRHPEILFARQPADIADRSQLQKKLLANAERILRPGGTLVYCTCSLEPEEGEAQAEWALKHLKSLQLEPVTADELDGFSAPVTSQGFVRTHPGLPAPHNGAGTMDGFFVARFVKKP